MAEHNSSRYSPVMVRAVTLFLTLLLVAACDAAPVRWADPVVLIGVAGEQLVLDSSGHASVVAKAASTIAAPQGDRFCSASLRTVVGTAHTYAVWWAVRRDSSADLYAAVARDSGRALSPPVAVDTLDRSSRGCNRPPPSLAIVGDDLQIAYSMIAPDGTGVFFAHFMGSMLHEPVAVIYGERLVATAIAADGDRVAVAYEDPNGSRARIAVALSSTQGHIFESHSTASRDVDLATAPSVALAGHSLAVAWSTRGATDSTTTRVVRIGRVP